ncbi:hypothetical protein [Campylobacter ureolyticus]|uniref:Uncharacterized protein n=1 Tax=Campylobacter ureolyticus TaxID=827 RepID=A0A9Q4PTZ4_9BACT|nr:hypothetical protein [Campylobacter ureolyticus]MCZ6103747.1 hypothetical protein [Campylobacter ureolyticus]MCZ6133831.1 hypothetical protein [Campylobacter ureolyticus]MCZ6161572.1 hypothetical protein [Campylobacter ureolyticus]MCZ6170839.1 hypothetical protein [Campylobacter ureolyticus]
MSRESIAKKELNKAEYRYKMSDKYNKILKVLIKEKIDSFDFNNAKRSFAKNAMMLIFY